MSTVKADTILAAGQPLDITLGASGDTVTVAADSINVNKVQDKGGNTLWDFSTGSFVSTNPAFNNPNFKLLATTTVSGASSVEFKTGIDSYLYGIYIFKFINMHPSATDRCDIIFNFKVHASGSVWL